jgi:hypothetical protein
VPRLAGSCWTGAGPVGDEGLEDGSRRRERLQGYVAGCDDASNEGGRELILATVKIEDFDRFWNTFSTKGAEKRKEYGSKGATVFRDPNEDERVWVLYDWDEEGLQNFLSDPDVPPITQEAGYKGRLQAAEFARQCDA